MVHLPKFEEFHEENTQVVSTSIQTKVCELEFKKKLEFNFWCFNQRQKNIYMCIDLATVDIWENQILWSNSHANSVKPKQVQDISGLGQTNTCAICMAKWEKIEREFFDSARHTVLTETHRGIYVSRSC